MRMRRKKNLDKRLQESGEYLIDAVRVSPNHNEAAQQHNYIDLQQLFGREAPLHLEIGCGKGRFACELARRHPELNIIAVEKCENVLVQACEAAKQEGLSNLRFMASGAEYLRSYLKDGSVQMIYLNFSCPFPKNKYAAHRLTNRRFLEIYKHLMAPGAEIHQKTDNMHFFEYSIEELTLGGFALKNVSLDLHASGFDGNIETEYEQKFSAEGFPIYRLEAYLPR